MRGIPGRLLNSRRGAIAMIFALALVPLTLMVGLAVDYAFYVQARAQASLAADTAAVHAVRAADNAYTYYLGKNDPSAAQDAETAGNALGAQWFAAEIGTLTRAAVSGSGNPTVNVVQNTQNCATCAAGFTATVSFAGTYPPFFNGLFKAASTNVWHLNGSVSARSAYNYVEILMLLDTSASMLIGATNADIATLEDNSVCVPASWPGSDLNFITGNNWGGEYYQNIQSLDVIPESNINKYNPGSYNSGNMTYNAGNCQTASTNPASSDGINYNPSGSPAAPCAFACHTDGAHSGAASQDLYGLARKNNVKLRLDVVIAATEAVIKAMSINEQAANQFTVGVYQFNTDVSSIVQGTATDASPEATSNLGTATAPANGTALYTVEQDDYNINPSSAIPGVVTGSCCNTNFPQSINDFLAGNYANATALSAGGNGSTSATPQKDIFIVTDGMEDDTSSGRPSGEMMGVNAENAIAAPTPGWLCKKLKNLNFTVYILYIDYLPLANTFYQTSGATATSYFLNDDPSSNGGTTQNYAEATSLTATDPAFKDTKGTGTQEPPDYAALENCASAPGDFFEAQSSSDIGAAMNSMLKAALTSSIQITQ